MLNDYLEASIGQLLVRAKNLQAEISKPSPVEFHTLWQKCTELTNDVIYGLEALLSDPQYLTPGAEAERMRAYKRRVEDLDLLENVAFAALKRPNDEDLRMTRLAGEIAKEIDYKLVPPVVSCQSQAYFHAYPLFNLLSVPQKEVDFLLHLPDLYHELGHFVLLAENNLAVEPFQKAHDRILADALGHLHQLKSRPTRGPKADAIVLRMWEFAWVRAWATEFCCDLFGVCAIGPAYGWAHLHLCMKRGGDPFHVENSPYSTHPPDDARMFIILEALTLLGFSKEAAEIEQKWRGLLSIGGYTSNSNYERCFPRSLLRNVAKEAVAGYRAMGCRTSAEKSGMPVCNCLNEAWTRFWSAPKEYAAWEQDRVRKLFET